MILDLVKVKVNFTSNLIRRPIRVGEKIYANGFGHITKMASMQIYGKHSLEILFSRTWRQFTLGLGMLYLGCGAYQNMLMFGSHKRSWLTIHLSSMLAPIGSQTHFFQKSESPFQIS